MKKSELKQIIREEILKEIVVNKPSLIYGITPDGKKVNFELDSNNKLIHLVLDSQ